ncbi:MAG: NADH-quinone oxidoreductase subunit C [Candidatus Poribacteria bacterium]
MVAADIYSKLNAEFGEAILAFEEIFIEPFIKVAPASIAAVSKYLAEEPDLKFDSLMCLSGADSGETLTVVYHLHSTEHRHKIVLKVEVPKDNPHVPTVEGIWRTANWHEREAYDLFGVIFDNHSDLRRILLPDDWQGHPLRKDYQPPEFYHGMPISFEARKE